MCFANTTGMSKKQKLALVKRAKKARREIGRAMAKSRPLKR